MLVTSSNVNMMYNSSVGLTGFLAPDPVGGAIVEVQSFWCHNRRKAKMSKLSKRNGDF